MSTLAVRRLQIDVFHLAHPCFQKPLRLFAPTNQSTKDSPVR